MDSLKDNLRNFDLTFLVSLLYPEDAEVTLVGCEAFEKRQVDVEDLLRQALAAGDLV